MAIIEKLGLSAVYQEKKKTISVLMKHHINEE